MLVEWLGVLLIDRRKCELTEAGHDYHGRIALALDQIGMATERVAKQQAIRLSVWCIPSFAYH